ncbi:MAG: polyphosphate polymerase domain-containing protein [Leptolyngbyaceae cyanobacterium MO_188.B28]|nr:polyphosphate polymerase domain-containing protein [Leptolyngbyaceae cyanobacterium MO_188.B28]
MQTPDSTRFEIKMVTAELMLPQVRSWLQVHPSGFYRPYPNRQINNVYFDTPHLSNFVDNLAGVSQRRKLRLRWYGADPSAAQGTLELKCKRNLYGWKESQRLSKCLNLLNSRWLDLIQFIRQDLTGVLQTYFNNAILPVLINQYHREYYLSFDGKVRVTIDSANTVYNQTLSGSPNLTFAIPPAGGANAIIEVKADRADQQALADFFPDFPLRVGRHSKYALGMEAIFS